MRLEEAARTCAAIAGQFSLLLASGGKPSPKMITRAVAALRRVADGLEKGVL